VWDVAEKRIKNEQVRGMVVNHEWMSEKGIMLYKAAEVDFAASCGTKPRKWILQRCLLVMRYQSNGTCTTRESYRVVTTSIRASWSCDSRVTARVLLERATEWSLLLVYLHS
jgi:hypothetical protein